MDLSGDPLKYTFQDFAPVFTEARNAGLGIAIHGAEVTEKYEDIKDILDFGPDRLGHGTFVEGMFFSQCSFKISEFDDICTGRIGRE